MASLPKDIRELDVPWAAAALARALVSLFSSRIARTEAS